MPMFKVRVSRAETLFQSFDVEAANEEEAYEKGLGEAYDFDYRNANLGESEYEVEGIEQISK